MPVVDRLQVRLLISLSPTSQRCNPKHKLKESAYPTNRPAKANGSVGICILAEPTVHFCRPINLPRVLTRLRDQKLLELLGD